jgi:hypothetical protein
MDIFLVGVLSLLGWIVVDVVIYWASKSEAPFLYKFVGLLVGFALSYHWLLGSTL